MTTNRPHGLGRGLDALIPAGAEADGSAELVAIDQIRPSSEQMRRHFAVEPLRELADSIREHGVLQPVLLKRTGEGYELIAGERRWRAARMAGLERVPAIVRGREMENRDSLLLGLVENLQREDLDPIEEARGIRRLIDEFGLTHEEAARRLGKHRVSITQTLRLLSACPAVQSAAAGGAISAGHARALVGLPNPEAQEHGLKLVLARQLSVRQTERWVRGYHPAPPRRRAAARGHEEMATLARTLGEHLEATVSVVGGPDTGRISIHYTSAEQLARLVWALKRG